MFNYPNEWENDEIKYPNSDGFDLEDLGGFDALANAGNEEPVLEGLDDEPEVEYVSDDEYSSDNGGYENVEIGVDNYDNYANEQNNSVEQNNFGEQNYVNDFGQNDTDTAYETDENTEFGESDEVGESDEAEEAEYDDENGDYDETDESEEEEYEEAEDENDGLKKKILIGGVSLALLAILVAGGFIGIKMMKKNSDKITANIENVDNENTVQKQETVIDENGDELTVIDIENEESPENQEAKALVLPDDERVAGKTGEDAVVDKSNLEIDDGVKKSKTSDDELADISVDGVGRKNPFMPVGVVSASSKTTEVVEKAASSEDFEIIEPPASVPADSTVSKLLSTKVSGIMYDEISPSAIINIDGFDQLVKIGDELESFFIIDITKNKVVIKSDANIYKASVGQPLNSEKVVNSAEISNLENKFYGSRN